MTSPVAFAPATLRPLSPYSPSASAREQALALNLSGALINDASCYAKPGARNAPIAVNAELPFWVRFAGASRRQLEVSNNGYVTFRDFLANDPEYDYRNLRGSWNASTLNIAAFWALGTGETETGALTTSFGSTTFQGRPAFCANWIDASTTNRSLCLSPPYPADWSRKNSYQLLLVDRSDVGYEDFDIVFNYGSIQWDYVECSGAAGAGYSLAEPGSGELISGSWTQGAFLNSSPTGLIHRSQGSSQLGRFVWQVRNGQVRPTVTTGGTYGVPTATSPGAWAENPTNEESEPVNTATGSYFTTATDLSLPGIGVPFEHVRTYNSADPNSGSLGPGWTHALAASLTIQANGDVLAKAGDGQEILFVRNTDGTFTAPGFARSTLVAVAGGYELTTSDQVHYRFDTQGRLTSKRDRNGQGLSLAYGGDGTLATVTDSVGRQITYTHTSGLLTAVALPDGRRVAYTFDPSGRLETVTDTREGITRYTYDAGGRLKTIVDQNQHTVVDSSYGPDGRVIEQRDARGKRSTFAWDAATQTSTYTDARLKQWKDVYRDNVLVERIDPLGNRTLYRYDGKLNLTNVIDPRGHQTTLTYDERGNLLTRSAPRGEWTYNAFNDPLTYKDGRDSVTTYEYDGAGNLIAVRAPFVSAGQPITRYGRDPAGTGLLTSITDPRGKQTTFQYTNGNLTEIRTQVGNQTTMGYDTSGRMTSLVEPRGNVAGCNCAAQYTWTYTYNDANQLETQTDPLGNVTMLDYDPAGNLRFREDAKLHRTSYGYDEANHLTSVTAPDPDGAGPLAAPVTRYTYDDVGNVATRQDANLRTMSYEYDDANRLSRVTHPGGRLWTYAYDTNGNLTQQVDANGNATPAQGDGQTSYAYDALNRLTSINYSDATPDVSFVYDGNGNRTRMTDGSGQENYGYDALNRLTAVSRAGQSFTYTYDLVNRTRVQYPDASVISYGFDDDERLQSVTTGTQTTTYAYDEAGNLKQTTLPSGNGYVETRLYDRAGRLTEVKNAKASTTISRFLITLDPVGNPTRIDRERTNQATTTETFTYDDMDRLTGVCFQASTCPGGTDPFIRWTYDGVSNRLTETRPGVSATSYTYNEADELTQAGSTSYTYDRNGNQLSAGSRTFTYDLANRVKTTTSAGETATYTYDGDGKRLQTSTGTQASKTTNFLWHAGDPLPQIALERDGNNGLLRRYVYGQARLSMTSGNSTYYFHHESLGSVANVTDASGVAQWLYAYEPFGKPRTETKEKNNAPANFMKFTGEYHDPTGLYHLRARQYDPATGRFLTRDPIGPARTDPYTSRYPYVGNHPTVMVDPTGLEWCEPFCGLVDPVVDPLVEAAETVASSVSDVGAAVLASVETPARKAVAVVTVAGGVAMVATSPVIYVACMRVTSGLDQIHCLQAAAFWGGMGLGAIYLGVEVWGKPGK